MSGVSEPPAPLVVDREYEVELVDDFPLEELVLSSPLAGPLVLSLVANRGRAGGFSAALFARYCASKRCRYGGYGAAARNKEAGALAGGGGGGFGRFITGVDEDDTGGDEAKSRVTTSTLAPAGLSMAAKSRGSARQ